METTHYLPFAREYPVLNTAVTALQFWMADHKPHLLSNAIERVYKAFFCSDSAQQIRNQPEETIFSHFVTTLSNAFKWELTQEDKGYESGSKSLNIPTPLRRAPWIYHVSMSENLSFNPTTLLTTAKQVFSSLDEESPERTGTLESNPFHDRAEPSSLVQYHINYHQTSTPSIVDPFQDTTAEEEDFPTAALDDNILLEDPVLDRFLCIHEQSQPRFLCFYPWPYRLEDAPAPYYEMMDLSDIFDFQDVMTTTSDEDIPDLDDVFKLWIWTLVCINIYILFDSLQMNCRTVSWACQSQCIQHAHLISMLHKKCGIYIFSSNKINSQPVWQQQKVNQSHGGPQFLYHYDNLEES